MLKLFGTTIAGVIIEITENHVTIEAHGNVFKIDRVNFNDKPILNNKVFIELNVYDLKSSV